MDLKGLDGSSPYPVGLANLRLVLGVFAILLALVRGDLAFAQTTWTTPRPIDTTVTTDQEGPLIAVNQSGTIAIVCREGRTAHLVLYTSDDNGTSFTRHQLASPPTPEYELYYPSGIAYDSADNLWVLWEWDLLVNGWAQAYYLSLSKSTDGGESFAEVLRHNRGLVIHSSRLIVDSQDNVHILRDSIFTEQRVAYTRLTAGNPLDRFDVLLPQTQDGYEIDGTFVVDPDSVIHYAVGIVTSGSYRIEYSRSTDAGLTFSSLVPFDSAATGQAAPRAVMTGAGQLLISYLDFSIRKAVVSDNQGESFSPPFQFGSNQPGGDGFLSKDSLFVYAFYASYGMVYNQFADPQNPPVDTASFSEFAEGQLGLGGRGEKYIVMRRLLVIGEPPYLFFSLKDIPTGVAEDISEQRDNDLTLRLSPNPFNSSTHFFITVPRTADVSVDVYDLLGRQVYKKILRVSAPATQRFALEEGASLATGMYLIRVASEGQVRTAKLLKIR